MSSIKKFYSRSELGLRSPKSVSRNITPQNGGVVVHYGGGAQKVTSQKQARERWLEWQRFHMNSRGWADIAYTAGFDNWGNVYAGRGYGVRTAAQGSGNQNHLAFCWIGGGNEKPSDAALEALNWLIEDARKNGNAGNAVKPHNLFTSTACPGSFLRSRASELDGKSRLPAVSSDETTPTPTPTPPASRDYITVGDKGSEVRSWQSDLRKWNSSALPRFGVDGDFGAETAEWTVRFYDSVGLSASDKSAPRVGDASREAMKKALAEASKPAPSPSPSVPSRSTWQGKQVRAKKDVNFYNSPGWAPQNSPAGVLRQGQRFAGAIHEARAVGGGSQYQVSNSSGNRFWITTNSEFVELVDASSSSSSSFSFSHTTLLRRGSKGAAVTEWQRALRRWRSSSLPRFGADGDFGAETHNWTRRFQSSVGIAVDGVVGPQTRRAMTRRLN